MFPRSRPLQFLTASSHDTSSSAGFTQSNPSHSVGDACGSHRSSISKAFGLTWLIGNGYGRACRSLRCLLSPFAQQTCVQDSQSNNDARSASKIFCQLPNLTCKICISKSPLASSVCSAQIKASVHELTFVTVTTAYGQLHVPWSILLQKHIT